MSLRDEAVPVKRVRLKHNTAEPMMKTLLPALSGRYALLIVCDKIGICDADSKMSIAWTGGTDIEIPKAILEAASAIMELQ